MVTTLNKYQAFLRAAMFQGEPLLRCPLQCCHLCCGVTLNVYAPNEQDSILCDTTCVLRSIMDKVVADTPAAIGPGQASVTSSVPATTEKVTILQ